MEESLGLQAAHDILEFGPDLDRYDHREFPGVVPRTFTGALAMAATVYPLHAALRALGTDSKFLSQIACRLALGAAAWIAFRSMRRAASKTFSNNTAKLFGFLMALQFHLPYYCTRTLPNTYALILSMYSHSLWLQV